MIRNRFNGFDVDLDKTESMQRFSEQTSADLNIAGRSPSGLEPSPSGLGLGLGGLGLGGGGLGGGGVGGGSLGFGLSPMSTIPSGTYRAGGVSDLPAVSGFAGVSDVTGVSGFAAIPTVAGNFLSSLLASRSAGVSVTATAPVSPLAPVTSVSAAVSAAVSEVKPVVSRSSAPAKAGEAIGSGLPSSLAGDSAYLQQISQLAGGMSASQLETLRSLQYDQRSSKSFVSAKVSGIGLDFAAEHSSFVGASNFDYHGSSCMCSQHGHNHARPAALGNGGSGGGSNNDFAPVVDAINQTVQIGNSFMIADMFTYLDFDNNPMQAIRVIDKGQSASSGYVFFNGARLAANQWLEVGVSDLNKLRFFAGVETANEAVGIMVSDGKFWSVADFARVITTATNNLPPTAQGFDGTVLSGEAVKFEDFILANDPENNLQRIRIIDRINNPNSGFFSINGVAQAQGQFFEINASQISSVNYHGARNNQAEFVAFQVYDGRFWSNTANLRFTTTPNNARPVLTAPDVTLESGSQIQVGRWLTFSDPDGNTAKRFRFFDTGSRADGGFFTVNGVVQSAQTWFEVNANAINTVVYNASANADFEKFRVMAFDGRFYSDIVTGSVTVNVSPTTEVPDVIVLSELERVFLRDAISASGNGLGIQRVYLYEPPSEFNGTLGFEGTNLDTGVVHEFSWADYQRVYYQGGPEDAGRHFDNFLVRFDNGVSLSKWERVNTITEVVGNRALFTGTSWSNFPGQAATVTYSFPTAVPFYYAEDADERNDGVQPLSAIQRQRVRDALAIYSDFANLTFVEVADNAPGGVMRFMITDWDEGILGAAYFPDPSKPINSLAGDVWIDNSLAADPFANGTEGWLTLIHEIGHAVGLAHPFLEAPGDSGNPLPNDTQNHLYTQMSYNRIGQLPFVNSVTLPDGFAYGIDTPMLYDILEIQRLYGANPTQNAGDDVYSWFGPFRETLRDTGGIDTISASNFASNQKIDLRPGRFSDIGVQTFSVLLTHDTIIENAISGGGNDQLFGNEANNFLASGGGNDMLEGGGGTDFLQGAGGNDTYVWRLGDGWDVIDEDRQAGRDVLQVYGNDSAANRPFGTINNLTDDFTFRRLGRDLRIDFTVDRGEAIGGITIRDYEWGGSRVESLEFFGANGNQLTQTISLFSIFQQATDAATRFTLTNINSPIGLIAQAV